VRRLSWRSRGGWGLQGLGLLLPLLALVVALALRLHGSQSR